MKFKTDYNIIKVIKILRKSHNEETIVKYGNILVSICSSTLFIAASAVNFLMCYFILSQDIKICIVNSLILLILGLSFIVITKLKINSDKITVITSYLLFISTIYTTITYYSIIGQAVWYISLIQIILSMIFVKKTMLNSVEASIIVSSTYLTLIGEKNQIYTIIAFTMIFIAAIVVRKINTEHYERLKESYKETIAKEKEIKLLAYHDPLTGLPNKRYFNEVLNRSIEEFKKTGKRMAVVYVDLDNFKMINDTMGHPVGDELLIQVSGRIRKALGKVDILARVGGDEFIILIKSIKKLNDINIVADRIIKSLNKYFILNKQEHFITASLGIAIYPLDGEDADTVVKNADIALYESKGKGKNKYEFFYSELRKDIDETMKLKNYLYRALEKDEIEVYYQPQVDCKTTEIVGFEALMRWNHSKLGLISPGKFIPLAEETGLIVEIGEYVLRKACKQIKKLQDNGYSELKLSMNLSVKQLYDCKVANKVEKILKETELNSKYLEFEITESMALKEKSMIPILEDIKKLGIHIALDDFGIEYSSLTNLKKIPVDKIKIGINFINGIGNNKKDEAIIRAIILLAKSIELEVVASGVEEEYQHKFLIKENCDQIQGYYFYKPMCTKDLENLYNIK